MDGWTEERNRMERAMGWGIKEWGMGQLGQLGNQGTGAPRQQRMGNGEWGMEGMCNKAGTLYGSYNSMSNFIGFCITLCKANIYSPVWLV